MAFFDTSRPVAGLSVGTVTSFVANVAGKVAAWNDARITRNSLSKLTARELEDIGLSYGDIESGGQILYTTEDTKRKAAFIQNAAFSFI